VVAPDVPAHVVQGGNNGNAGFFTDEDYFFYLERLEQRGCRATGFGRAGRDTKNNRRF
jgi:putative transposase